MEGIEENEGYDKFLSFCHKDFTNDKGKALGFLGFPSAKDPDYHNRHPGISVGVLISELPYSNVKSCSLAILVSLALCLSCLI